MKKLLNFLTVLLILASCKDVPVLGTEVELDSLIRAAKNGDVINLTKNYTVSHTNILLKDITINGNGFTLKREDQITYTLKEASTDKYFIVEHSEGIEAVDRVLLCPTYFTNNIYVNAVIKKSGDTLFTNSPQPNYPAGTKLYKNIMFFWVLTDNDYTKQSITFNNVIFDGNRENNRGTISWHSNAAVTALTSGVTTYNNCTFKNSPGESIVGHNAKIDRCTFMDLNGSGFHTSQSKVYNAENTIQSTITNSLFLNTNEVLATVGGHSEGAITHSNSGGYYSATNNTFYNVGESVLGALYGSNHEHDWGTNNILFKNNTIKGAGRIVYLIDTTTGPIYNVNIEYYKSDSIGYHDFSKELEKRTQVKISQL